MTTPIYECVINKKTITKPIWLMRQAGRYLPEFREIRKLNSDILMIPYGLNQKVNFKINFGPELGNFSLEKISEINELDFINKLEPIYKSIKQVKKNPLIQNKDLIGFVGAPWTLLVYMINKISPKKKLIKNFFKDDFLINKTLLILEKFLKLHIKHQVKNGATTIQIFDSWAGLLEEKNLPNYVYKPTLNIVNYVKSLNIPVICFPREIKNYKKFCEIVKPDVVSIDYNVDPKLIIKETKIPIQGGLDPKILLSGKENLRKESLKYLNIFKNHPYIFNLGHGVLPETDPMMVDYLVKLVKDY